ncbi:MAG: SGNH/GDSL hydrolase family protein [Marmoricola sp.]
MSTRGAAHSQRRTSGRRFAVLAVAALVGLVGLGACGKGNPKPSVKDITTYVALGDSYTAVSGAGPFTDTTCLRSDTDYPALVAKRLSIPGFENVSCGGATSDNLTQRQFPATGTGSNPPQLDALTHDTTLVTLGIGGNDFDLGSALYPCLSPGGRTTAACAKYLNQSSSGISASISKVGVQVAANIRSVRKAAPGARIILVGYPRVLADDTDCPDQVPVPAEAAQRIRETGTMMNDTLRSAARRTHVDFIDMYAASEGHDVCSASPWVNGQRAVPGQALPFHPYVAYHEAVADKIVALLSKK